MGREGEGGWWEYDCNVLGCGVFGRVFWEWRGWKGWGVEGVKYVGKEWCYMEGCVLEGGIMIFYGIMGGIEWCYSGCYI